MSDLHRALVRCGGSESWARAVVAKRPDTASSALLAAADAAWSDVDDDTWREAFDANAVAVPPIGDEATRGAAQVALTLYRQRFGHAFVSSTASGAADELLMRVRIRLGNELTAEWRTACDEQRRLTRVCLEKWLAARGGS